MESASVPQTHDPNPDEPHGPARRDGELSRAYERIKSAGEDLARLDRLVSGLERGSDSEPIRQEDAGAAPPDAAVNEAPAPEKQAPHPGQGRGRLMRQGLVALLLAIGILGAAFASRYGTDTKAILARWTPQAPIAPPAASELRGPTVSLAVQVADAAEQPSPPPPASHKDVPAPSRQEGTKDLPPTAATAPDADAAATITPAAPAAAGSTSADVAQSLKTIAHDLASINDKLEQLKSSHEQTLRDHAEALQQLKAAQQQNARDNARNAEQVQALQTQLAVSSAKSSGQSPQSPKKETVAVARPHLTVAAPRPPGRPRAPWMPPPMPPPGVVDPWDDPYW